MESRCPSPMWLSCAVTLACLLSWSSSMAQSRRGDHSPGVRFAQDSPLMLRHDGWVQFVAFSNDGTLLASVSDGNDIIVWDSATWERRWESRVEGAHIVSFDISADGRWLAVGDCAGFVRVYDTTSGQVQHSLPRQRALIRGVSFSPDGRALAAHAGDGESTWVDCWSTSPWADPGGEHGPRLARLDGNGVRCFGFSGDGRYLALGWSDPDGPATRNAVLVHAAGFPPHGRLTQFGHKGRIGCLGFSPDDRYLATGSDDGTIRLWETGTWSAARSIQGHSNWVSCIAFSPDGSCLASGSYDNTVKTWDVATGEQLQTLYVPHSDINALAFSSDGRELAAACDDAVVRIWEMGETRPVAASPQPRPDEDDDPPMLVRSDADLYHYHPQRGMVLFSSYLSRAKHHSGPPGHPLALVAGMDEETLGRHRLGGGGPTMGAWSPDGKLLAVVFQGSGYSVNVFDQEGELVRDLAGPGRMAGDACVRLEWAPDGSALLLVTADFVSPQWQRVEVDQWGGTRTTGGGPVLTRYRLLRLPLAQRAEVLIDPSGPKGPMDTSAGGELTASIEPRPGGSGQWLVLRERQREYAGQPIELPDGVRVTVLAVSASGKRLAVMTSRTKRPYATRLGLLATGTGQWEWHELHPDLFAGATQMSWSLDEAWIAIAGPAPSADGKQHTRTVVLDTREGDMRQATFVGGPAGERPVWSPEGSRFVAETNRGIWVIDAVADSMQRVDEMPGWTLGMPSVDRKPGIGFVQHRVGVVGW